MNGHPTGRPSEILLVEDNPGDVRLVREALAEGGMLHRLRVFEDGVEAMAFLLHEWPHPNASRPNIILLDLNLPKKDGREVLAEIKANPELRRIPVVVLTTSEVREDIIRTYDLHANCTIIKPVDVERFFRVIRSLVDFWLNTVELPGE
jgi:CheY-like chemotaxis protein